ncbi:MAG: DUF4931 domain-containing protein [Candidatus Altiarchaeota archaeon]
MPELRKDYFLDRYVIIASERKKRPEEFLEFKKQEFSDSKGKLCFFCPGNENTTPPEISRIEKSGSWIVRNFPNKFPATKWHEVIVETPEHDKELTDLDVSTIVKVFELAAERVEAIEKNKEVKYVIIFKNFGEDAGASLGHSHMQIAGMDIIPPSIKEEIFSVKRYMQKKGRCPYCDILNKEKNSERKIFEDKHTLAFSPYASRFPYEVWIMPKRHLNSLKKFKKEEILSFCETLRKILLRMRKMLSKPAYNFYMNFVKNEDLHLHLVIFPRITKFAGFEFGSDVIINIISPEDSAKSYREKI